ncbi:TspO/MBR family protein [Halorhabdus rudnickae]|uniref:TspO/MBR family protein n=1 Tax=Halorhabdus rudnickae TaxID=1775544 RepID=UPI0010842CD1|nr:TspO/MBR family protein [Halorhabdus rudnickae]
MDARHLWTLPDRRPRTSLLASVLACEFVGASGSVFTVMGLGAWYDDLAKPWFNPPSWVFGPVWTLLFALMGVALWLVWRADVTTRPVRIALLAFAGQFVLNIAWSAAFFGAKSPVLGLLVITALWLAIVGTIVAFDRVDRRAALLLVPYLAWVSFAAVLNASLWWLN